MRCPNCGSDLKEISIPVQRIDDGVATPDDIYLLCKACGYRKWMNEAQRKVRIGRGEEMISHVLGCGCNECTYRVSGCPYCKWGDVSGQYSCVSPHEWFWDVGLGDTTSICKYCGNCGKVLPDKGIHPEARK